MIKKITRNVLFGVVALTTLSQGAFAQSFNNNTAKLVVTTPVTFLNETRYVEAVGSAEAVNSVVLYPAVSDEVTEINFTPGELVEAGQVLVRLDDRRQRVAVKRAELELKETQRTLSRLTESFEKGAIPVNELDLARTQHELAEVALEEAQADLDDRRIVAPFKGIVGLTDIEVGDRITAQTIVTTLDNRDKLFINFRAPESSMGVLMNNPIVTLEPWTNRQVSLEAQIAQVDSRVNEEDRTVRARAILDNSADSYRPGMSFRVNLTVEGERFAAVPEASLLWGAQGAYIWLSEDGKAKRVDVNVHQRLRGKILITGDVREGDTLIAEGVQRLRNGQEVTTALAGVTN